METLPIVAPAESIPVDNTSTIIVDNTLLTTNSNPLVNEINLILPPFIEKDDSKLTTDDHDVIDDVTKVTPKYKYNKRARRSHHQVNDKMTIDNDDQKKNHKNDDTQNLKSTTTNENVTDMISESKNENNNMDDCGEDDDKPIVKLVISKKKGSIFKSRAIDSEAGKFALSLIVLSIAMIKKPKNFSLFFLQVQINNNQSDTCININGTMTIM